MSRPTFIEHGNGLENWDSIINTNFLTILRDGPFPIKQYSNWADLPAANQNDRCLAVVFNNQFGNATSTWILAYSDGTNWKRVGSQAAAQSDSNASTLGQLVGDFNALLTKLKNSGLMAKS